jgi:hypothetical protein
MAECRVKRFVAIWSDWSISWGSSGCGVRSSTIQLPVTFKLELEEGSTKADCIVGQEKRGRSEINGHAGDDVFEGFTADGDVGNRYWWDGKRLSRDGRGQWDNAGRVATFEDAPGFSDVPAGRSLYMGAAQGRTGYFNFRTFVMDVASNKTIREINWSIRIDVPTPGKGGLWWSFSDQK